MATLADCNSKISELVYILKAETKALRNGDFSNVEAAMSDKSMQLADLDVLMAELGGAEALSDLAPQLALLHKTSVDNGVMLKSAFNGFKAAHNRVELIKNQNAQVGAYGRAGRDLYFHEDASGSEKTL